MKSRTREYGTSVLQLDIRVIQRSGTLVSGRHCTLRWDETTTAKVATIGNMVRIELQLEHARLNQEIDITYSTTGIGSRGWWCCPACSRRCAVLFLQERLACRECSGLHFETQSATARRRALLKANKLRALYGADPEFPCRPLWMRQAKFEQKMRASEEALAMAFPFAGDFS
jgi:hypothetical protein